MPTLTSERVPPLSPGAGERHLLPEGLCRTFGVLAYDVDDEGVLLVATADADDVVVAHVVSDRLGRPVRLVTHDAADVRRAVDDAYPPTRGPESPEQRRVRLQTGQLLLRSRLVTDADLHLADLEQRRHGGTIADVLLHRGVLSADVHLAVLAEVHGLQRVSLLDVEPDPALARRVPLESCLRMRATPVAETERHVVVAAAQPLAADDLQVLERQLARPVRPVLAPLPEVERLVVRAHAADLVDQARTAVMMRRPDESAHVVASPGQRVLGAAAVLVLVTAAAARPLPTFAVLVLLAAGVTLAVGLHRCALAVRSLRSPAEPAGTGDAATGELPTYTVLVPLHHELESLPGLLSALDDLDYPRTLLEVLLLCEEGDPATVRALESLPVPTHARVVVVPESHPATKAKACNLGLRLARGEQVVVFDADDRPAPGQLRAAAAAVATARGGGGPVCLQSPLHHDARGAADARDGGVVAAWARGLQAARVELELPALCAADAPVLLGPSAHHVPAEVLREVGGWDPFNVAAEADLGVRLRRCGHSTGVLGSRTGSTAPQRLGSWSARSARAYRGLLLTALVQLRHPGRLLGELGFRRTLSLVLTLAGLWALLLQPVLWAGAATWLAGGPLPDPVGLLTVTLLVLGHAGAALALLAGGLVRGEHDLVAGVLLAPVALALLSLAAWRGVGQLVSQPYAWEPRRAEVVS